jgi:hypothetical protein
VYEFRFTVRRAAGVDPVVDAHESVRSEATYACLSRDRMWRLESVTGEPGALETIDDLLVDPTLDREGIGDRECEAVRTHSVLTDEPRRRVVFTHFADARRCDAVPLVAVGYAPTGMLAEATREGRQTRWRLLFQDDRKVGMLYDTLTGRLGEDREFSFESLGEMDGWQTDLLSPRSLPAEQRETLELAAERGYFETPRETTLDDIAAELGAPRSTVSYRLRRATAALVAEFVDV